MDKQRVVIMDLLETVLVEERLEHVNRLLEKHNRTDLKVIAVNKYYDWSYVCLENGNLKHFNIWDNKIRSDGNVMRDMGPNYILINDKYSGYESVELKKKRHYTTCPRSELETYLADGWEIEED